MLGCWFDIIHRSLGWRPSAESAGWFFLSRSSLNAVLLSVSSSQVGLSESTLAGVARKDTTLMARGECGERSASVVNLINEPFQSCEWHMAPRNSRLATASSSLTQVGHPPFCQSAFLFEYCFDSCVLRAGGVFQFPRPRLCQRRIHLRFCDSTHCGWSCKVAHLPNDVVSSLDGHHHHCTGVWHVFSGHKHPLQSPGVRLSLDDVLVFGCVGMSHHTTLWFRGHFGRLLDGGTVANVVSKAGCRGTGRKRSAA